MYLETERLVIKPHTMANLDKLHSWMTNPDLLYYDSEEPETQPLDTLDETRRYLQRIMLRRPVDTIMYFAVHTKADDLFIGYGMVAHINRYHRHCHLGITIGDMSQWGQGYAREVCQAVIGYCFDKLDMNRIGVEIYDYNERSIRLFESLGFRLEGRLRQNVLKKGRFADELLYGLLKSEWNGANRQA